MASWCCDCEQHNMAGNLIACCCLLPLQASHLAGAAAEPAGTSDEQQQEEAGGDIGMGEAAEGVMFAGLGDKAPQPITQQPGVTRGRQPQVGFELTVELIAWIMITTLRQAELCSAVEPTECMCADFNILPSMIFHAHANSPGKYASEYGALLPCHASGTKCCQGTTWTPPGQRTQGGCEEQSRSQGSAAGCSSCRHNG
jgi:hypothetical protein